ncbi:MAG: MBL fold metallo-hydrolase [Chloroflexi bacterium]|jgi:glyoxylase-like metal-dependent hydrolase (beta-lactamase superfamily II)|nr:MBL fold metallo-hydrolase [Chloroflexota bacterium]GIW12539.1 MAG: MBL fold metallo-hydrolase [Dehalococcoidia bacterium]
MTRPPIVTVGSLRVHLLSAGWYLTDAGVAYGIVPKPLWSHVESADPLNRIRFELRCLLIEAGGLRILVDSGYGEKLDDHRRQILALSDSPRLEESLAQAGYEPADIDLVVATHLHADHCGGHTTIRSGAVVPAFPRARYVIQRGEYEVACQPNERTRATYLLENYCPLVEAGVVDFVAGDVTITPGVRLELAPGHTADHCVLRLQDGGETALFLADLAQRPVQLERLAWIAAYDVLPLVSLETKRRIATEAAQAGHLLIFQHHPAVGRLAATERGWQFVPQPLPTEAAR